mgnify:CR=1 FL=1
MTCENNCCLNTPTSVTERVHQDRCVPLAEVGGQEKQHSLSHVTETACCGCVTEQAVDSEGVVALDDPWEWDTQHVQHNAEEQWDELTSVERRSFLQVWLKYFRGSTF